MRTPASRSFAAIGAVACALVLISSYPVKAHTPGDYFKRKWIRDKSVDYSFTTSLSIQASRVRTAIWA